MRIVHAIPVYAPAWQYGGPVLSVSRLCEALGAAWHNVQVLTTNAGLPDLPVAMLEHPVMRQGVKVWYFPVNRQQGTIRSAAMQSKLHSCLAGADVLHLLSLIHL